LLLVSIFFASLLGWACLPPSARASARVYWANYLSTSNGRVSFANLDGSGGADLNTTGATSGGPRGVSIDVAAGRIYWTNPDNNAISFTNLDGSGGGDVNTTGATVDRPNVAAAYPQAGRVYWANETGDTISFAGLDGSGGGGNLSTPGATVDVPIGPALDPGTGRIYWGNGNPVNKISFAGLDGSGGADLNTSGATVDNPHGVALDPVGGRIYWANLWGQKISYANLNGTGGGDLNTSGATVNYPAGVAIDPSARKIYWANRTGNKISFASLDGSGGGNLSTTGATVNGSMYVALLQAPSGAGAPTIAGGSGTGSVLTCSQGSWAPDLLASFLYRVPQAFAYSWTLNGQVIPGAGANVYTASAAGDYRCTVTASNTAGNASQTSTARTVTPAASARRPHFGAKTLVTLRLAARQIPASGRLKVVVANGNSFAVSGKVSVMRKQRVAIRGKAFTLRAKAKKRIGLKLPKKLVRLLKRKRKLSLRLNARVKDPEGNTRTVTKKISPKLKTS
jgi:DNA-binding beta-propeller fold protein YncE